MAGDKAYICSSKMNMVLCLIQNNRYVNEMVISCKMSNHYFSWKRPQYWPQYWPHIFI